MRKLKLSVALACSLLGATANADTLTILTWEAYFDDDVIAQWEDRSGARVKQIHFDSEAVRDNILNTPEVSQIDLVTIDPITAAMFGKRGTFLAIDRYKPTANLAHANNDWAQKCAPYTTPYLWGTLGLVYRKDKLATPPNSWQNLLAPSPALAGHIGFLENFGDTLSPSLFARNEPASSNDRELLREVFTELQALLPSILTFDYAISFIQNDPLADELHLALAYTGDEKEMNTISGNDNWEYVIPNEGSIKWGECLGILNNSAHAELAMDFIDYLNIPEIAAQNSETLGIATTNDAAQALQSNEFRNNPLIYPPEPLASKLQFYTGENSSEEVLLRNRIITTLVGLHEPQ